MGPTVEDWVRTLGMSRALVRLLNLPLHLSLEEFLESLPGDDDDSVQDKLRNFLKARVKHAVVERAQSVHDVWRW